MVRIARSTISIGGRQALIYFGAEWSVVLPDARYTLSVNTTPPVVGVSSGSETIEIGTFTKFDVDVSLNAHRWKFQSVRQ